MKLSYNGKYFILDCTYSERHVPKELGFSFDPKSSKWYTKDPMKAIKLRSHGDEELSQKFKQYKRYLRRKVDESKILSSDIEIPKPDNGKDYFPFQRGGIKFLYENKNVLLGDQQGTGKTIQVAGLINLLDDPKKILIICPNSLKMNWERELKEWIIHDLPIRICDTINFSMGDGITIVNYEAFRNNTTRGSKNYTKPKHGGKYNNTELILREIKKNKTVDLLVLDESHNIKNYQANTTRNIFKLSKWVDRKILMSGSPMLNRPEELWTTIKLLGYKDEFGGTKKNFGYRYCDLHETRWGWDYRGSSNLKELQIKLRTNFMIRRTRKQVLKDLPSKSRKSVTVEISNAYKKHLDGYDKIVADLGKLSNKHDPENSIFSGINPKYIGDIAEIRQIVGQAKIIPTYEYTKEILDSGEKVVLFAQYHRVLDSYKEKFKKYNPAFISGKVKNELRQAEVDRFQEDDDCRIIILQFDVGSVGYNLTESFNVVFAELHDVPLIMNQAEDRCNRIGSVNPSVNHYILAHGTLDARMGKRIIEKQEVFDKALETDRL